MAAISRIVDISEDALTARRRRRRARLRIGVPILGVVLVIAAIFGIAVYSHSANKKGALALSDDLINTLDAQIAQRALAFLDPTERSLRIMRDMARDMPLTERRANSERFAISVLHELPQISAFYVGDSAGDFLMVRRHGEGVETKQIINAPGQRGVIFIDRNAAGEEIARREDPSDTFDPRTRPWFQGALGTSDVFWTGIYIFFSDRKPGITVSTRVQAPGGDDRVFGVDVSLEELSRFLGSLEIGAHGRALIMDDDGKVIAIPNSEKYIKQSGDTFVPPKVDELGDPVLTKAFDRFRVEGKGRRIIAHEGVRYISSVSPLPGANRHWWIQIVVPEDDFIGFVASNNQTALLLSLIIVLAVAMLAILLIRQGVRSDRSVRQMTERGRVISQQSAIYAAVSEQIASADGEAPPALTEGLVAVAGAQCASIWRFNGEGQVLRCLDSYDTRGHAGGFELHRRELPGFFEMLEAGEEVAIANAAADRRSAQFSTLIMHAHGTHTLSTVALRRGGQILGGILLEDATALEGAKEFVRTLAAMFAASLTGSVQAEDRPAQPARPQVARERAPAAPILSADLDLPAAQRDSLKSDYFPEIAVATLVLSGSLELAKPCGAGDVGMATQITLFLQDLAGEFGVTYVKFVGQEAIAAAGFEDGGDAMTRIASLAIATRDRLSLLIDTSGDGAEFRIGLAFGGAYGCLMGRERQQFNMWGETFEMAGAMARSAQPGAIQASAAAYDRLRQDFLFRPRGTFYRPGLGQSSTFVLAGQL